MYDFRGYNNTKKSRITYLSKFVQICRSFKGTLPVHKLCDFIDLHKSSFIENYTPNGGLCIDEYLLLWKGRFRVYIPSKRERCGIKIYMLCDSETGYLLNHIVYTGADTVYLTPQINLPKSFEKYLNFWTSKPNRDDPPLIQNTGDMIGGGMTQKLNQKKLFQ